MNNLGTKEQGKKVYDKMIRALDDSPNLTSFTYKAPEYYNLRKYMMQTNLGNRLLKKYVTTKQITFTLRNVPPASTTKDYRDVVVKMKSTEL